MSNLTAYYVRTHVEERTRSGVTRNATDSTARTLCDTGSDLLLFFCEFSLIRFRDEIMR